MTKTNHVKGNPRLETISTPDPETGVGEYRAKYVHCNCGNKPHKFYVTDKYLNPIRKGDGIKGNERMWCLECDGYLGQMHQAGYGEK